MSCPKDQDIATSKETIQNFSYKRLLVKSKTSFTNCSETELFSEFQNIPNKRFVSVSFGKVTTSYNATRVVLGAVSFI